MLRVRARQTVMLLAFLAVGLLSPVGGSGAASGGEHSAPVLVAVGDLVCPRGSPGQGTQVCRSDLVADLITEIAPDRFLALGDLQYEDGSLEKFLTFYDAQFGHLRAITAPVPGNHEYYQPGAKGYFDYFGAIANPPEGYYSFDLGSWHLIALNSEICGDDPGCGPGSPQYRWLRADLEANADADCVLAFDHHPRYDWRPWQKWIRDDEGQTLYGGSETEPYIPMWELLHTHGADVVLSAHNHLYQRWIPQDAHWNFDPNGVVQFTVGTGGRLLYPLGRPPKPENLASTQNKALGVLKLSLNEGSYDYEWVSAEGQPVFVDAGSGTC
jgi:hypothetical protein